MKIVTVTQARKDIYKLLDDTIKSSEPIQITGKRGNGILISESDWNAVQETLYLLSIPNMRESIIEGLKTSTKECVEEIDWDTE